MEGNNHLIDFHYRIRMEFRLWWSFRAITSGSTAARTIELKPVKWTLDFFTFYCSSVTKMSAHVRTVSIGQASFARISSK